MLPWRTVTQTPTHPQIQTAVTRHRIRHRRHRQRHRRHVESAESIDV